VDALERISKNLVERRRSLATVLYAVLVVLSYALAYSIRFEFDVPARYEALFLWTVPLLVAVRLIAFRAMRLMRERWRYVSTGDVARLGAAAFIGSLFFAVLDLLFLRDVRVPLSILVLEMVLTCMLISTVWLTYRLNHERRMRHSSDQPSKRVLIIGAGEAGNLLAREMRRGGTGYHLVGFVDDDPSMRRVSMQGVEIMGDTSHIAQIVAKHKIHEIFLAIPSAEPATLRRIVENCEGTRLPVKVLPGIKQVMTGEVSLNQLRDVRIEDLLGREPVDLHLPELAADLADCVVLITGAAGSIGSELARQVALHSPRALVILDQAETPLFFLDLELREAHPGLTIHPVVCDIVDAAGIEEVFARFRPDRVFHAAAYKHVPMMEFNTREAFRNNVIGSLRVADAAGRFGARRFVLVSTDKAVRPANAMGTSKRFAEILTLECQEQHPRTSYSAVRFGNVLGTAGSVLQVFERQIEQGRPLTVTHPEATRYFMTVQEAVHLILHASVLNECQNRIVVLDMGEPVKILDMARRLLCHAGVVDVSSRITFIGLRPGEKLHEELIGPGEVMERTPVSRIRVVKTVRQRRGVSQRPLTLSGVTGRLDVNRSSRGVAWM